MAASKSLAKVCGGRKQNGKGLCRRPRGWGTDHPGFGRCKHHGGSSPSGRKAAEREEVRLLLGASLDVDPADALLQAVRRTAGLCAYFNQRVSELKVEPEEPEQLSEWVRMEAEATERLARFSKSALDAGIAERRVRMAERAGELISTALERALQRTGVPARDRTRLAEAFATELAVLEAGPDVVEGAAA